MQESFTIQKGNIFAVPILHYNMEMAAQARLAFEEVKPDCVAVELAETMQLQLLHAASRLPDVSLVATSDSEQKPLYYMVEPCDGAFEGLRSALEKGIPAYCIDLDVDFYPEMREPIPDPYAIHRIGLKEYYEIYRKIARSPALKIDRDRELYMARRLKELSLSHDRVLFIGGMAHIERILRLVDEESFPHLQHAERQVIEVCTLTEKSTQEVMAEFGWISQHYEDARFDPERFPPDRQKLIYHLYKAAGEKYIDSQNAEFPGYHMRNLMKFVRNYALTKQHLMPDLFQILTAAKGCVGQNYAYETWLLGTDYPYRKNIDNLPELDLTVEQVWGRSKIIRFKLREEKRKGLSFRKRKDRSTFKFQPPGMFGICSYPKEDLIIENFGRYLQKKGLNLLSEEGAKTIPFSTSLEDGLDMRETIRHWAEKKLYVKTQGKPSGGVGSIVVIFEEDAPEKGRDYMEQYPWKTTWLGEHEQESDMAFFATPMGDRVVGPGISRCEYGGFLMSYPPRRMYDVWHDPDYASCRSKAEVLLMAGIDYAVKSIIVYVAPTPPRTALKTYASRFDKKIVYLPLTQLSPIALQKIRSFHVLDGHDKRQIADEYIE